MEQKKSHIIELLQEFLAGTISAERQRELEQWLEDDDNRRFFDRFCAERLFGIKWKQRNNISLKNAIQRFDDKVNKSSIRGVGKIMGYVALVAMFVVAVGISWFYWISVGKGIEKINDGGATSQAMLILADGQRINLQAEDSLSMCLDEGISLTNQSQCLVYTGAQARDSRYNELRVPKGGEYAVVLSDGTKVWLNSSSSLKYPEVFGNELREVILSGEAYLEVAKSEIPFRVVVGDLIVQVYGTSFNINTHLDDKIQTVLVEGKIGIKLADGQEYVLAPSQLADYDGRNRKLDVKNVDVGEYIAWHEGIFWFKKKRLEEIMLQLSLWYDVEIFYQNSQLKDLHFTAWFERSNTLEQVIKLLEKTEKIKLELKGKTLIVKPYK